MFDREYQEWNQKRIKTIIDFYGSKFFYMKKVLDLGCGYADVGGAIFKLGADVSALDARKEHLKIVNKKYPGMKTFHANIENQWPFNNQRNTQRFDLIIDMGLLCHVSNYEAHLKMVCASTTHLVLESSVCDSDETTQCVEIDEDKRIYDLAFSGKGCRPSAAAIEKVLDECGMNFKRIDSDALNTAKYKYTWLNQNDYSIDSTKRRFWIAVKKSHPIQFAKPVVAPPPVIIQPMLRKPVSPLPVIRPIVVPTSKVRLFYNYYEEKNVERKKEIDFCFQKNINNGMFDIIVLESENKPTFDFFFEKINRLAGPNDISIICNSDIFFDNSLSSINKLGYKEVFALNRWNWSDKGIRFDDGQNQDTWIVRGKVEGVVGDFQIGMPNSNNRIAYEFDKAGYKITNPSKSMRTLHVHSSNVRNYTEADTVPGPYLNIEPISI